MKFMNCWKESMESWNYWIPEYWIIIGYCAFILGVLFSFLAGNILPLIANMISYLVIPLFCTFVEAITAYKIHKEHPEYV